MDDDHIEQLLKRLHSYGTDDGSAAALMIESQRREIEYLRAHIKKTDQWAEVLKSTVNDVTLQIQNVRKANDELKVILHG